MTEDIQLLERFATGGDEDAFRELVECHLDLVYSAALRRVNGDAPLAEDVAQTVFTDLARKARSLPRDVLLTGWLYEAPRFPAANAVRSERRRQAREQEALTMQQLASESAPRWEHLAPVLDDAMGELSTPDRNAILLRYFKNQDFHAVGLALGVSDAAAQRRVSRAVERLREFFAKRGVTVGASGLVVVISANAVQAAPAGLAGTLSTAAVLAGTTLTTTATAIATKAIVMTATQKVLVAAVLAAAIGTAIYEARQAATLRTKVQTLQQQTPIAGLTQQLTTERDENAQKLAAVRAENERLNLNTRDLLRLRGEVGLLRAQTKSNSSRYEGRTVNEWLQDYDKDRNNLTLQAQNAIRQMGTNAIPDLLVLLHSSGSGDLPWRITCAFQALGPKAKPAVPGLIEFLQTSEPEWIRAQAAASLGYIGSGAQAAIPALIAALGDKENVGVRMNSIGALTRIGGDPSVLVPVFIASLDDPGSDVRDWAATGLSKFGSQAESAVPKLLEALSKPDDESRVLVAVARALESIGPTTTDVAPVLLKLFSHPNEGVRNCATNALKRIDPGAALNPAK